MSLRIEQADPLTLMRELPDRWAQTCVTSPPDCSEPGHTLAILAEVRRVMRDDGTLWLRCELKQTLLTALVRQGWMAQPLPVCLSPLVAAPDPSVRLFLFTKRREYFFRCHTFYHRSRLHTHTRCCVGTSAQSRRTQRCNNGHERSREILKRCVLASTSIIACGACGAPYRQARLSERAQGVRRATCAHHNPEGRCLVLDPFYKPRTATAEVAHSYGRSFLGICQDRSGESR
jgi:hypothetical protein